MASEHSRRQILKGAGAALAASLVPNAKGLNGRANDFEIQLASVSEHTIRLSVLPIVGGHVAAVPLNGTLALEARHEPELKLRGLAQAQTVRVGSFTVELSPTPLTITFSSREGKEIQQLRIDPDSGRVSFTTGDKPLLGLGEGGPQFDRRGSTDRMRSGQGGYRLATNGGRVPIPWIVGTGGWALFFHQPLGTFDFSGPESRFIPTGPLPLDLFLVSSEKPATIMAEYARLTGHPELPPLWSFGYQQSHRTLASREEVLAEAKTFREKKLPCDTLIYLGTGFCPSGWNVQNGSFEWNKSVFPDPKQMLDELHREDFHAVFHVVIETPKLRGTVHDKCDPAHSDPELAVCHWQAHREDFGMGVDGWWPDEGDPLDLESRLVRNRMYWEGPQVDRPNERPFALHRNGAAGMQRYGAFLWSGDVDSTWETLKTHLPIAINTGLSGIPFWGTDIGGFVPTKEFTAELYVRWFQFGSFCPLFRCHGRNWKLRLPWGWNTGDPGPIEIRNYSEGAVPDASQLHDPLVEPICRKYLELRYRLMPYLYSVVREGTTSGMPVLRSLWLHFPDDPVAVAREDEYMWGSHMLVAPVVERGAATRRVYLPKGQWFDFWTNERIEGGREIVRDVDLETMPLYVKAGSILPLGPVKQHTGEHVEGPLVLSIYPGADGSFLLYEDDGKSFDYRKRQWTGTQLDWKDKQRKLTMRLAQCSRMLPSSSRNFVVKLGENTRPVEFNGQKLEVSL